MSIATSAINPRTPNRAPNILAYGGVLVGSSSDTNPIGSEDGVDCDVVGVSVAKVV